VLLGVRHLIRKDTLQRRQPSVRLLQFHEPSLTVGHTGYAVGDADLRNAAELIGVAARRPHAFTEIPLYFFLSHAKGGYYKIFCISSLASNFVVCIMAVQTVE
jgi:hypothetical protein